MNANPSSFKLHPSSLLSDHLDIWTSAIKAKSSAGRGGGKKQEFHGIKKLRELILELAVRGLLVPQEPEDEPASELLKKIRAEEARLVKAGEIKKRKLIPRIQGKEKPFELPTGWEWIRLAEAGHDWGQKTPDSDFTYIDVGAINKEFGLVSDPSVLPAGEAPSRARKIVKKGTVIYSTVRPYLLNIAVVSESFDPEPIASTAFAIIHPFQGIEASFVYRYLRSPTFIEYVESCQTGIAYPAINDRQFFAGLLPLPPLAEQHRIVTKVDELMALCDQLEQRQEGNTRTHAVLVETLLSALTAANDHGAFTEAWQQIAAHFHTLFSTESSIDQLKQTILQLAVMGKLVPRDCDEGTAHDVLRGLKIPEIEVSVGPILPEHWAWVLLGSATKLMNSGWSPACETEPAGANSWGVLKTTAVQTLEYLEFENKTLPPSLKPRPENEVMDGDILFTRAGPTNRVGILCVARPTRPKLMLSDKIIRFHLIPEIDPDFAALSMSAGYSSHYIEELKSGMAASQVNISQPKLRSVPIPIPPLAEQDRIVAKVGELMAVCDRLKARLQRAQNTQLHLADTLIEAAI